MYGVKVEDGYAVQRVKGGLLIVGSESEVAIELHGQDMQILIRCLDYKRTDWLEIATRPYEAAAPSTLIYRGPATGNGKQPGAVARMEELPRADCWKCHQSWVPRIRQPRRCPRCGQRLRSPRFGAG